tara:strand:- start:85 stop:411 length:327 start_codon:yes stop_codon:yes gene_type:complete
MTALQELLAKVKAGECDHGSFLALDKPVDGIRAHHAYNGSLDAAKALHDAVLPCCSWSVAKHDRAYVSCMTDPDDILTWIEESAQSANPARAWLIAIIKALIAKEKST